MVNPVKLVQVGRAGFSAARTQAGRAIRSGPFKVAATGVAVGGATAAVGTGVGFGADRALRPIAEFPGLLFGKTFEAADPRKSSGAGFLVVVVAVAAGLLIVSRKRPE